MSLPSFQQAGGLHADRAPQDGAWRLASIEAVARAIQTTLEPAGYCQAALTTLEERLSPVALSLYHADAFAGPFTLLAQTPVPDTASVGRGPRLPAALLLSRPLSDPLLIEDLQAPTPAPQEVAQAHTLAFPAARGCLCVPLWYADQCQGLLTALFPTPLVPNSLPEQILLGCQPYLAAALAHTRRFEQVQQERTQLRTVLDQIPQGVLIVESVTNRITSANQIAAEILGVAPASLLGQPFHHLAQPDPALLAQRRTLLPWSYALIQAFCGQTVSSLETVVRRPDGSPCFLLCSSTPLFTQEQQVAGAVLVFQDLSAQVSLDQQKNRFLGMLSHELRTPVTVIQGFADLLSTQAAAGQSLADPLSQRAFANMVAQSQALTHLIGQLLDLSRLEQAQLTLSWGHHDLVTLLTSVVEALSLTAPRHHLHLVLQGRQASQTLLGWFDWERMQQVLYHLIANAIK
jgi:PAS domain S-box-containing protein